MSTAEPTSHKTTKNTNAILLFLLLSSSTVYLLWILYSIPLIFYVAKYKEITQIGWFVILVVFFFTGLMLTIQRSKNRLLGIGLFAFTTMLCCLSTYFVFYLPTIFDSAGVDDHTYYLTGELDYFDILAYHRLYKCANSHIQCETTSF